MAAGVSMAVGSMVCVRHIHPLAKKPHAAKSSRAVFRNGAVVRLPLYPTHSSGGRTLAPFWEWCGWMVEMEQQLLWSPLTMMSSMTHSAPASSSGTQPWGVGLGS